MKKLFNNENNDAQATFDKTCTVIADVSVCLILGTTAIYCTKRAIDSFRKDNNTSEIKIDSVI